MGEHDQATAASGRYAGQMIKRTDRLTAFYVDLAINTAACHGAAAGAEVLFRLGLPLELARRVLLNPAARRGASQPIAAGSPAARLQPPAVVSAPAR